MISQPSWLSLVNSSQRTTLVHLLVSSPPSRRERANTMLAAPPLPSDESDAQTRAAAVIQSLIGEK